MKKYLKIIIPLILICITGLVIYHFVSKVKLNSSYVNGNTAGNLYNAGLFCESDGEVFFSNTNTILILRRNVMPLISQTGS